MRDIEIIYLNITNEEKCVLMEKQKSWNQIISTYYFYADIE